MRVREPAEMCQLSGRRTDDWRTYGALDGNRFLLPTQKDGKTVTEFCYQHRRTETEFCSQREGYSGLFQREKKAAEAITAYFAKK